MTDVYKVLALIWSVQHGRYIAPGEVVEFDMTDAAEYKPDVEALVAKCAITSQVTQDQGGNYEEHPVVPDEDFWEVKENDNA